MRQLFQLLIRLYWFAIPPHSRRNCLFRESCSRHVYRILAEKGFKAGVSALYTRYRKCRPGYKWEEQNGKRLLILVDGSRLQEEEISEPILNVS